MTSGHKYWEGYGPIQQAKHEVLKNYLNAWFPILGYTQGRILYVDCHAGRGRHKTGDPGSPLVALETFLDHDSKGKILNNSEISFFYFEKDEDCYEKLQGEVEELRPFPNGMNCNIFNNDYKEELGGILKLFEKESKQLAPSLFFLDPFNFNLPIDLLRKILNHDKTELLITFMARQVDMALGSDQPGHVTNMNELFGTEEWKPLKAIDNGHERRQAVQSLYFEQLGGKYKSALAMQTKQKTTKYYLIHITNHPKGRRKMKNAMWNVSEGKFEISEADNLNQLTLIEPEPNLTPLKESLLEEFAGEKITYERLDKWILNKRWLKKHLHEILRDLRDEGVVNVSDYGKRFAFSHNPVFEFPE